MNSLYLHLKVATPLKIDKVSLIRGHRPESESSRLGRHFRKNNSARCMSSSIWWLAFPDDCLWMPAVPSTRKAVNAMSASASLWRSGGRWSTVSGTSDPLKRSLQSWPGFADFKTDEDSLERLRHVIENFCHLLWQARAFLLFLATLTLT